MDDIMSISIEGIDGNRPPNAKYPQYINLYFRLNNKAPEQWCALFNEMMVSLPNKPKIVPKEGLYIETWVKSMNQIAPHLEQLKSAVHNCSKAYLQKLEQEKRASASNSGETVEDNSPQATLNRIIESLDFSTKEQ